MFDPDRRHLIAYIATAAVLVVIAARFVSRDGGSAPVPQISMAAPASATPARARPRDTPLIWVDVAGAVRRPGLYSLPPDSRVAAALERAGGANRRANRAAVNLAAKLVDGQQVFVPPGASGNAASGAAGGAGSARAPISLSNATQAELEQLDGIGPALAQRIIEYREQHGGFKSIDELQEVPGIGAKRFEALKDSIVP